MLRRNPQPSWVLVFRLVAEMVWMMSIHLFVMLSLDGYLEGPHHDLSGHIVDDEFNKFAMEHLRETGLILFRRRTYQLMKNFWPKPAPCCFRNGFVQEGIVRSD